MGTCVIVFRFFTICGKHVSIFLYKIIIIIIIIKIVWISKWFFYVIHAPGWWIKGDFEDAAVDCCGQHVQELLHHRWHVPPPPLLCVCRCCPFWNSQIWREHQQVWSFSQYTLAFTGLRVPAHDSCRVEAVFPLKPFYGVNLNLSTVIAGTLTFPQQARLSLFFSVL